MCTHAFIGRLLTDKTNHLTLNPPGLLVLYWSDEAMDFHTGNWETIGNMGDRSGKRRVNIEAEVTLAVR